MPPWLWGRAEAIRTSLRTAAQAVAPLLFGAAAQYVFGGGTSGLRWTFVVMLLPLAASAVFLYRARRLYPTDVATTTAITSRATRPNRAHPTQAPAQPPTEAPTQPLAHPRRPTEPQPPPTASGS